MSLIHIFFLVLITCTLPTTHARSKKKNTAQEHMCIMLDPSGDAKYTGRQIENTFERGITLQCVEAIKKELSEQLPQVRVTITRTPGETVYPLQNANFANRLGIDAYVSIHFYHETRTRPRVYLYRFGRTNDFIGTTNDLTFYPYNLAHTCNKNKTEPMCQTIYAALTDTAYTPQFDVHGIYTLPLAPLIGITAPAIGIEIGIKKTNDWRAYIQPLVHALGKVVA